MSQTDDLTHDYVLGGRVRLCQPRVGYRAGLDAAFLAAAICAGPGRRVLDLGCGVGGALLPMAWRNPDAAFVGVERDPVSADLARRNAADNGWSARVQIITTTITAPCVRALGLFDAVICNPPFFDDAAALRTPHPARVAAYIADDGLGVWLDVAQRRLRAGGRLAIIHRADRLGDIVHSLTGRSCGVQILPLHPFAGDVAKRVVVVAQKGSKAPLRILPGIILHESAHAHTNFAESVLRGEDKMPFFT